MSKSFSDMLSEFHSAMPPLPVLVVMLPTPSTDSPPVSLEKTVEDVTVQVAENKTIIAGVSEQVALVAAKHDETRAELGRVARDVTQFGTFNAETRASMAGLSAGIAEFRNQNAETRAAVAGVTSELATTKSTLTQVAEQVIKTDAAVTNVGEKVSNDTAETEALRTQMAGFGDSVAMVHSDNLATRAALDQLLSLVSQTRAEMTDTSAGYAAVAGQVDEIHAAVMAIAEASTAATNRVAALEALVSAGNSEDIVAVRSPTSSDTAPAGKIWRNEEFGARAPLKFLSTGAGWIPINRLALTAIRVYVRGWATSFTGCDSIRFRTKAGATMPMASFTIGDIGPNMGSPLVKGMPYAGQASNPSVNTETWLDLVPVAGFNLANGLSGCVANFRAGTATTSISRIDLIFNNGGVKTLATNGAAGGTAGANVAVVTGVSLDLQHGAPVDSLLAQNLDVTTAGNPASLLYGRVNGQVLSLILAPMLARLAVLESKI